MTRLDLPDPALVVLVGAAGSGKSTFARRWFPPDAILSSDAYRAAVTGDEADQSASAVAFRILHRELERRLAAGRTAVVDATNLTAHARRPLLAAAATHGIPAVAIVLDLPADVVRARARRRARVVPDAVIERHLATIRALVDEGRLEREGYATVVVLSSPAAVDAVELVRRPAAGLSP